MTTDDLLSRILRFLDDPTADDFDQLATDAFRLQAREIPVAGRLATSEGIDPDQLDDWRRIPLMPTLAFKGQEIHLGEPREIFRSSGTRESGRSVHHHAFPDLYRAVVDRSFPGACLRGGSQPPMLALIPNREIVPDSSLGFMIEHVVDRWGREDSAWAMGPRGVKVPDARSWLGARQRDKAPAVVLATSLALNQLLDAFEKRYLHFRLAPGSTLFETGGFKGRSTEVDPVRQLERIGEFLGLGPDAVVREYGMTELTSQAYADQGTGWRYRVPHWVRVRSLDVTTLEPADGDEVGLLAFLDLGNLGSAVHVLTEDLGRVFPDGTFELVGRAGEAELRGCSLTAEALAVES